MNVWMAESSMLHMKTKSNISGIVLVSKKDFEAERANSALSNAENMTKQYQIAHEGEEGEGNEEGGREERAGAEQVSVVMPTLREDVRDRWPQKICCLTCLSVQ